MCLTYWSLAMRAFLAHAEYCVESSYGSLAGPPSDPGALCCLASGSMEESWIHLPHISSSLVAPKKPQAFGPDIGIPNIFIFIVPAIPQAISAQVLWFSPRPCATYCPDPEKVLLEAMNGLLSFKAAGSPVALLKNSLVTLPSRCPKRLWTSIWLRPLLG